MKRVHTIIAVVFVTTYVFAQSPQKMSYQAVIRDNNSNLITYQPIGMRISILHDSITGIPVYVETQSPITNANGLVSIEIAGDNSTIISGNFANIDWANGPYYIKTETDPTTAGGSNYTIIGTSQLLSVPYALFAEQVGNVESIIEIIIEELMNAGLNGILEDVDGNWYKSIKIGNQVWMAENLRTTKYNNGTTIPLVTNNSTWENLNTAAYCWYDNDLASYANTYGALYNWYTVDTSILCPAGWHIPTNLEWTTLINYLGGEDIAGGKLKALAHWASPNTGATNETGFTALPGGYRRGDGTYSNNMSYMGDWWTSSESSTSDAYSLFMYYDQSGVHREPNNKNIGFSVRCIRD